MRGWPELPGKGGDEMVCDHVDADAVVEQVESFCARHRVPFDVIDTYEDYGSGPRPISVSELQRRLESGNETVHADVAARLAHTQAQWDEYRTARREGLDPKDA